MDATTLNTAILYCDVLIGNAHEIAHIRKMLPDGLAQKTVIETDGARPVRALLADGNQRTLPTPAVSPVVDPTGCGDAFVAGMVHALLKTLDESVEGHWERNINDIVRAGIRLAGRCLTERGSQTYSR
jgi:sugar/nucleoside kinase (ribokinase family)